MLRQQLDLKTVYLFGFPIYRRLPTSETMFSSREVLLCALDLCYGLGA
jgi:hypothetical protein